MYNTSIINQGANVMSETVQLYKREGGWYVRFTGKKLLKKMQMTDMPIFYPENAITVERAIEILQKDHPTAEVSRAEELDQ
jgi:hypothetical protein